MNKASLASLNTKYQNKTPEEIINWALEFASRPVLTTNFGPYSSSLIHAIVSKQPDIPVLWGDSGYNLNATYKFSKELKELLHLNLKVFVPQYTRGYLDAYLGDFMSNEEGHKAFTELVKIEPLQKAFNQFKPDVWFTNIRKDQTDFRKSLDIFSLSSSGILKVSPFYYYTENQLLNYINTHNLPNELAYFDPTKVLKDRECGLHLSNL